MTEDVSHPDLALKMFLYKEVNSNVAKLERSKSDVRDTREYMKGIVEKNQNSQRANNEQSSLKVCTSSYW
jgi:hypothetical protein